MPAFSFNEVEVYDLLPNEPGSKVRIFQNFVQKWTGIPVFLMNGAGFFQNTFGFLPRRTPITTVVGSPIKPVQKENPTSQEIDEVHQTFIEALKKLFEDHKHKYLKDSDKMRLIIE